MAYPRIHSNNQKATNMTQQTYLPIVILADNKQENSEASSKQQKSTQLPHPGTSRDYRTAKAPSKK